jgi:hypothetical protein
MTEDFNKWWNADQGYDGVTNPYRSDSAVYWAWEGWQAGVEAEREWQGLTDEEVEEVERWVGFKEEGSGRIPTGKLIRYIEAKLKEKNSD